MRNIEDPKTTTCYQNSDSIVYNISVIEEEEPTITVDTDVNFAGEIKCSSSEDPFSSHEIFPNINTSHVEISKSSIDSKIKFEGHNIDQNRAVSVDILYDHEIEAIKELCKEKIESENFLTKCFNCSPDDEIEEIDLVSIYILKLIEEKAMKKELLFIEGNRTPFIKKILKELDMNIPIKLEEYDAQTLSTIFIEHLLCKNKILIPKKVAKSLFNALKRNKTKKMAKLLYYLPHSFDPRTKKLISKIFKLIRMSINQYTCKGISDMIFKNIVKIFFPREFLIGKENEKIAIELIFMISFLNYEFVPIEMINKK